MNDKHILDLIENTAFNSLSESELNAIQLHTAECSSCQKAFAAAKISSLMLKERTAEVFEPSPFFNTRVLAHLRERQAANETWAWHRIWRTTAALASSMVATVAALAVLTFVIPDTQLSPDFAETSARNAYSAEEVILNPGDFDEQASDGSVLTTLYDAAEDGTK